MKALTYTRRENSRRAALKAGLDKDKIQITVHKSDSEVRFGWMEKVSSSERLTNTTKTFVVDEKAEPLEKNGIKMPISSGICANIWKWLDLNHINELKEMRSVAAKAGWNTNTATRQFYAYRRFHGLDGCQSK